VCSHGRRQDCAANVPEEFNSLAVERARAICRTLRMDGRQQEQRNEQYSPCRQGKVRCLHDDIGNSMAFRHDNLPQII